MFKKLVLILVILNSFASQKDEKRPHYKLPPPLDLSLIEKAEDERRQLKFFKKREKLKKYYEYQRMKKQKLED